MEHREQTAAARVVIAVPVFNEEKHLARTLDSLLGQTEPNLRVVVMDNRSTDDTARIARAYAAADPRVHYEVGESWVGLIDNWRRGFFRARALHPSATYFAWWGGHDVARPRWLEALAAALDADPSLVGAFPTWIPHREDRKKPRDVRPRRDTAGVARARHRAAVPIPGDASQGLLRPEPLESTTLIRRVYLPDRLFVTELAALGGFRHVPEPLWERHMPPRMTTRQKRRRQLAAIFPEGRTLTSRLPWLVVHLSILVWTLVVRASAHPETGRMEGLALTAAYARRSVAKQARSSRRRVVRRMRALCSRRRR